MRIGYGRVSTRDQDADAQHDALAAAACDQIFIETASGKLARRPELDRALLVARSGDEVVVTKLDRLGRSLEHLIELFNDLQEREVALNSPIYPTRSSGEPIPIGTTARSTPQPEAGSTSIASKTIGPTSSGSSAPTTPAP